MEISKESKSQTHHDIHQCLLLVIHFPVTLWPVSKNRKPIYTGLIFINQSITLGKGDVTIARWDTCTLDSQIQTKENTNTTVKVDWTIWKRSCGKVVNNAPCFYRGSHFFCGLGVYILFMPLFQQIYRPIHITSIKMKIQEN